MTTTAGQAPSLTEVLTALRNSHGRLTATSAR